MSSTLTISDLRQGFRRPPRAARPMMRWWWFGPDVEDDELDAELRAIADAGFGGVEVSYVYPLSSVVHPLLSEQFLDRIRFAADRAKAIGLRFDLTLGTGWSFGGPHIDADHAARHLVWERREVGGGALEVPIDGPWPGDEMVAAFVGDGSMQEAPTELAELPVSDRLLRIPAGRSPRVVLLAYSRLTGQNVKRAAAGGEGPVLDHYSADATAAHIAGFAAPLVAAVDRDSIGSVFCDSLEVYESNWTPDFLREFDKRRGYDAAPQLYRLVVDTPESAAFRVDFHRTLTELYEQNFVAVLKDWAGTLDLPFRIQGYGTPPASVSSYRFADLFEGEGWGWNEVTQTRWAASAAHIYGLPIVSSEVWTWVHSPSFRATPLDLKGEAHEHLLAGVNQLIGHGWPYSPADAPGLGWMFYASGAIDDRNPWWPAMPELTAYLQRLSWLLRQGEHVAPVKLYVPAADVYGTMGTGDVSLDLWRETKRHIGPDIPRIIHECGLDFDLVDDDALAALAPEQVTAVVLPFTTVVPNSSQKWLDDVAQSGGTIIHVDGPGTDDVESVPIERFASRLSSLVPPDYSISPVSVAVGVLHRRTETADVYLVVNTGNADSSFTFQPRTERSHYEVWNPADGGVDSAGTLSEPIPVQLPPYAAVVVVAMDASDAGPTRRQTRFLDTELRQIDGPWAVQFLDDGGSSGVQHVVLPDRWEDRSAGYSGSASYETSVDISPEALAANDRLVLDVGSAVADDSASTPSRGIRGNSYRVQLSAPVREVAVVTMNGVRCGTLWAPPYEVDLLPAAVPGVNRLQIEVFNTAANALDRDDAIREATEQSVARYGRRFRMQDLDLAMDGVSSGLLAVPTLRWQRRADGD